MLTCIACSKQLGDAVEDEPACQTPRTKVAVKTLTSQIKEMVLKFSGAYRQCKPCNGGASLSSSGADRKGGVVGDDHRSRPYGYSDAASESGGGNLGGHHQHHVTGGSSTSTPGWDFASINAESADSRFTNGARWWTPVVGVPGVERTRDQEEWPYDVVLEEDDGEPKEWMAQVEPGVRITFISLPGGGNDLKRIRFRDMFNKWQAQRWWGENYDRIMELYNVQRFSRQAFPTPPRSEDERDSSYSRVGSRRDSSATPPLGRDRLARNAHRTNTSNCGSTTNGKGVLPPGPDPTEHLLHQYGGGCLPPVPSACWQGETSSLDASRTTTSSSVSVSNGIDQDTTERVEQDEPGVYITIRQLPDGTREIRRVRFSREHFSEKHAKQWWEENRERIQAQYQ